MWPSALESISVSLAGDALSWPSLDVDVYVPGLVERAFGTRLFAGATGQRGGRRRSKAKAAAARANGRKGGDLASVFQDKGLAMIANPSSSAMISTTQFGLP